MDCWYVRFRKGEPNGLDKEKPVQVAADPWGGKAASFAAPPKAKRFLAVWRARGAGLSDKGRVVHTFRPLQHTVEQFGAPVVTVTASTPTQWPHLVMVLTAVDAHGAETILSEGGTLTSFGHKSKSFKFSLISDANLIRRGMKLRLYLGGTSIVQNIANLLYLKPVPEGSRLKVGLVTVSVPVLPKTISR